jgi:F0F1-type ATP synthase membrane subunit b/b'
MEGLGINLGYLIVQILAFVFLIILLKGWLYNPIV